jgi:hypothetical protein
MGDDRLKYFLGKPIKVNNVDIFSPTINEIADIGEIQYNVYLSLATFNKEVVFINLLNLSDDKYKEIENIDTYDLFISVSVIRDELINALRFFTKKEINYSESQYAFLVENKIFMNKDNYIEISEKIKELNGIIEEDRVIRFKNEKAKQMYEKLQSFRNKYKKSGSADTLSLKDILSILCNAEGNGINVFNVGQLTIYQVYALFERLNLKEQHTRLLRVWANGYLGENHKLPEWIIKSKF